MISLFAYLIISYLYTIILSPGIVKANSTSLFSSAFFIHPLLCIGIFDVFDQKAQIYSLQLK